MSIATPGSAFGTRWWVSHCASRRLGHGSFFGSVSTGMKLASETIRNWKSPTPKALRQFRTSGSSRPYSCSGSVRALDSPWYQIAPLIANGVRGAIIAL